ncbi:unnamed protein product, partial [Amoebophrya sp. A25]|eukprot:GSA25T00002685001.1
MSVPLLRHAVPRSEQQCRAAIFVGKRRRPRTTTARLCVNGSHQHRTFSAESAAPFLVRHAQMQRTNRSMAGGYVALKEPAASSAEANVRIALGHDIGVKTEPVSE